MATVDIRGLLTAKFSIIFNNKSKTKTKQRQQRQMQVCDNFNVTEYKFPKL